MQGGNSDSSVRVLAIWCSRDNLTRDSLSAFYSFNLADIVQGFGELDHGGVLGVHLKEIDEMRSARAIKDAFLNQKNRITVRVAVKHGAAHAATGARAGDEQAVDVLPYQIRYQMRAKKGAGARLTDDELTIPRFDQIGKLDGELFEIGGIDATLGSVPKAALKSGSLLE